MCKNQLNRLLTLLISLAFLGLGSCRLKDKVLANPSLNYRDYQAADSDRVIDRNVYHNKLEGFWLGTCLANWTGLITEMDKIGNIGEIRTGEFYTRHDWGGPDQPSIWGQGIPSGLSPEIDFVWAAPDSVWGADDDTDIEYMYQELMLTNNCTLLTGLQIRDGWLKHIKAEEENFLWVSNQRAYDLMKQGFVPPATGDPANNAEYEMIDAQLTTEIFGLFAPARPDVALQLASLPVKTTARFDSEYIANFYISLFSLASAVDQSLSTAEQLAWMTDQSKNILPLGSTPRKMYDFVKSCYDNGLTWEQTRDSIYLRYQVQQQDGYTMTARNLYCNGCFAAGTNFAASLVSLFYGEGDFVETIKIAVLAGWDSDNPAATWGGLLGFMIGKDAVEQVFNQKFSQEFHIHRTRINFGNDGTDTFENMAAKGIWVTDRIVQEFMNGGVSLKENCWYIPSKP